MKLRTPPGSTSSSVALGKAPMTSPGLAGLASGKVAPSEASTHSPAIQFLKSCIHTPYLSGGGLGVAGDLDAQSAHRILEVIEGSLNPLPTGPAHTEGRLQRLRRGLDLAHPLTAGGLADVDLGPGPVEIPGQGMHLLRQRDGRQPICQVQAQRFELANLHLRPSAPFRAPRRRRIPGWLEAVPQITCRAALQGPISDRPLRPTCGKRDTSGAPRTEDDTANDGEINCRVPPRRNSVDGKDLDLFVARRADAQLDGLRDLLQRPDVAFDQIDRALLRRAAVGLQDAHALDVDRPLIPGGYHNPRFDQRAVIRPVADK